ncbi:hypothetical protein L1049_015028 [Liquidambar formosana]|uniref:Uncharacterized protein n=1 Tax=Liquidambar formosana TaxID=63359 RepID=A0AAP0X5U6_LIQFO
MAQIKDPDSEYSLTHQTSSFLIPNGIHSPVEISDIEMISIHSLTYTSLKDLLPARSPARSPSMATITSPTHNSSWHEIPIKNPLVKHAAWAYLQPMSTPPESDDRNFFLKLKDKCCYGCGIGCFAYFGEVLLQGIKQVFSERREIDDYYDDDDDEEEDKVD